jgi:protein arginine N-methyltransferase 1
VYDIHDFGKMLADPVRTPAYLDALRRAVTPGCTVLEIGTGTGLFAMLARRWGAAKVYAIEPLEAIEVGRQTASANGLADGIEFIRGLSTEVNLPQRADVLVSDLRGPLPLFQAHIPSINDARDRLLAPGGVQIPARDTIRAAVVEAPVLYGGLVDPWRDDLFGLDQKAARNIVTNMWRQWWPGPQCLLTASRDWTTIDYRKTLEPHFSGELSWTVQREGTAHGLTLWFDAVLAEGIEYSNAPGEPKLIYGNAFFPFSEPVRVTPGDRVRSRVRADLVRNQYVWTWRTLVLAGARQREDSSDGEAAGTVKATFVQSTFFALPMGPRDLATQASDHRPRLNEAGHIQLKGLGLMDGSMSVGEIADDLAREFPARFQTSADASHTARGLSREYSDWRAG